MICKIITQKVNKHNFVILIINLLNQNWVGHSSETHVQHDLNWCAEHKHIYYIYIYIDLYLDSYQS